MIRLVSRSEGTKVLQNLEADRAGFLRMELNSKDVIALDGRREYSSIFRRRYGFPYYRSAIRVCVIHEGAVRNATQQTRAGTDIDLVPANMGRLHSGGKTRDFAGKQARALSLRRFAAAFKQPLHAYADSQKGLAGLDGVKHRRPEGLIQALAAREMANARHHELFGDRDRVRHGGYRGGNAQMLERLVHGADVAGAVVNDSDHSSPLVLGSMRASCRSREQATRKARAKALNKASIL